MVIQALAPRRDVHAAGGFALLEPGARDWEKGVAFPVAVRSTGSSRARIRPDRQESHLSKTLRILVSCVVLAGLGACAAPPPPPQVVAPPPAKKLDAKTQLENHS
jgi:hypothetical protein